MAERIFRNVSIVIISPCSINELYISKCEPDVMKFKQYNDGTELYAIEHTENLVVFGV